MELRQQIDLQQLSVEANIQQPEPQLSGAAEPSQDRHGLATSSSQVQPDRSLMNLERELNFHVRRMKIFWLNIWS